jgi:hypothetical protein
MKEKGKLASGEQAVSGALDAGKGQYSVGNSTISLLFLSYHC